VPLSVSRAQWLVVAKKLSHTGGLEVLLGELGESTLVEDVLEVFKSESELEDSGVDVVTLDERSSAGNGGQERHGAEDGVLHDCLRKCCWKEGLLRMRVVVVMKVANVMDISQSAGRAVRFYMSHIVCRPQVINHGSCQWLSCRAALRGYRSIECSRVVACLIVIVFTGVPS
jgi:hypothetical protein